MLDGLLRGLIDSYREQFLLAHFRADTIGLPDGCPALNLAISKHFHDALSRWVIEHIQLPNSSLTPTEYISYLELSTACPAERRHAGSM